MRYMRPRLMVLAVALWQCVLARVRPSWKFGKPRERREFVPFR